jgi:phenylacetate-CoA ligase
MGTLEAIYQKSPIALQTLFLNAKAAELYIERYGRKFWRLFEEFNRNQWLSQIELEAYQNEKLRLLIEHVYQTVPYYSELMKSLKLTPSDIKTRADLYKLPILKREDIRNHLSRLISSKYPRALLRHGHTSGTTGSPLDFFYDVRMCVVHHVADWRQKYWGGLTYGQPYASLLGRVIVPVKQTAPPFWRFNYLNNQLFLSSFHLNEINLPYYFDELKRREIQVIEGYPSTLYILALYLLKNGRTFPMKTVLTLSETLFDSQRQAIEQAFACKIFDHYGMAERAVFASECDLHSGHHLNLDYGIVEFLDSEEEPVSEGHLGKIVATSVHNFAMPFIRYETNDASALKSGACVCGRGFPLMDDVATKHESIVTLPDGRLISPSVLTHPFKPMHNIVESQIIQEQLDELVVKVVKRQSYTSDDEVRLVAAFHERLGNEMKIKVEYVESIPRTRNAKFRWVISKIPPTFH